MTFEARIIWPVAAQLGEGPMWHDGALWFVDIKQGRIHRHDPASDTRDTHAIDGRPSFIVPAQDGFVIGDGLRLARFRPGHPIETLARIAMPEDNRTNDATVDAAGRLWFGTMDDAERAPTGRVYRYDGAIVEMGGACTITNGPAISPDGRWLYHVDTLGNTITRFDMAGDPATLNAGEPFVTIEQDAGHPDGVSVDAEGHVWVGLWGGWAARRYAPDGTLAATVAFPCANVTKVTFGGPDLTTAYATTARVGIAEADLARQPLAGGLFAFDAPAPGLPANVLR